MDSILESYTSIVHILIIRRLIAYELLKLDLRFNKI